ncbi:MAG: gamma-glutamylcyclotransferase [Hyphomicrobiales bacterium]|nr:gamma-glutamylcyclotransferase [Hyphomicrobiales bacterium]MDE2016896.1 gamma-glutamylcyclotransferase [Hyphomicrobiales bacterium]
MPLHFAYGANLDAAGMAARCPGAKALGPARLARHRLAVATGGWLTVVRDPREDVHGLLWELGFADLAGLDRFEETARGLYAKLQQPVIGAAGPRRAIVYVAAPSPGAKPRADYLAAVAEAARAAGLPAAAQDALRRLGAK